MSDPDIHLLVDHPGAVPIVARWWFDEWGPSSTITTLEARISDLTSSLSRVELPIHVVAVLSDEVVGVAALKLHELERTYPDRRFWVGGVFVRPDARGRGIGTLLVAEVEAIARRMALPTLHLGTRRLDGGLYAKLGWQPRERISGAVPEALLMTKVLRAGVDDEPAYLVRHDARWAAAFDAERLVLERVLAPWLAGPIEHVGSTAVPGLIAKPVIDVMAAVTGLAESRGAITALAGHGYLHWPYQPDVMHWLCKPSPSHRTHHLNLVPFGSALWREKLAFRDRLSASSETRAEYADLKRRLATLHPLDREAYTSGKGPFVQGVIDDALGPRRSPPS